MPGLGLLWARETDAVVEASRRPVAVMRARVRWTKGLFIRLTCSVEDACLLMAVAWQRRQASMLLLLSLPKRIFASLSKSRVVLRSFHKIVPGLDSRGVQAEMTKSASLARSAQTASAPSPFSVAFAARPPLRWVCRRPRRAEPNALRSASANERAKTSLVLGQPRN